jgi:hypothetical protein
VSGEEGGRRDGRAQASVVLLLGDESDPDILVLRRQDGYFVAAFSTRVATREGIIEAAQEDYRALSRELSGQRKIMARRV